MGKNKFSIDIIGGTPNIHIVTILVITSYNNVKIREERNKIVLSLIFLISSPDNNPLRPMKKDVIGVHGPGPINISLINIPKKPIKKPDIDPKKYPPIMVKGPTKETFGTITSNNLPTTAREVNIDVTAIVRTFIL